MGRQLAESPMADVVDVRSATLNDAPQIVDLNRRFQRSRVAGSEDQGFLSLLHTLQSVDRSIGRGDAVVAECDNRIIAYLLIASPEDAVDGPQKVKDWRERQIIDPDWSVGVGVQAVVEPAYRGRSIYTRMSDVLIPLARERYAFLLSDVRKTNSAGKAAHRQVGWRVVEETDDCFILALPLSDRWPSSWPQHQR